MTIRVRAGGSGQPTSSPFLDLTEALESFESQPAGGGAGSASAIVADGYGVQFASTTPVRYIYNTAISAAPALFYDALIGRTIVRHTSAGANVGRTSASANPNGVRIPSNVRFQQPTSIPSAFLRPPRAYTLRNPVRVPALAGGACFVGISDGGAGTGGNLPFSSCAGWTADPALNGGRWTAQHRLTAGGAIVTDLDSGVQANATWHQLGMRYTEGPVPTLEWLLDDVPVFTLTGDANMLVITSFGQGPFPEARTLAGAGTTMDTGPARFTVEEA